MTIGEKINALMKKRGLSQNRLAKAAQISQSGLSSIISGSVSPKEATLKAIADVLDCPVWELLKDVPEEYAPTEEELGIGLKREETPKTPEARIVSGGMDSLPKEQREMILNMLCAMFPTAFMKGDDR